MHRILMLVLAILTILLHMLLSPPRAAASDRDASISTILGASGMPSACSDLDARIDGREALRAEETISIPLREASRLSISLSAGSGVSVAGTDGDSYVVVLCKAARDRATLQAISLARAGEEISVNGPEDASWSAHLLIRAPKSAALDLGAANGPIGARDLSGSIRARTNNGPISIEGCTGDIDAGTRNGPIHFIGSGHNVDLRAENGPLSVELSGSRWEGGEMRARTQNGPLSLSVSSGYRSGVQIETSGNAPFACDAQVCDRAESRRGGAGIRYRFGSSDPVVYLSTVNGPVSVGGIGQEI